MTDIKDLLADALSDFPTAPSGTAVHFTTSDLSAFTHDAFLDPLEITEWGLNAFGEGSGYNPGYTGWFRIEVPANGVNLSISIPWNNLLMAMWVYDTEPDSGSAATDHVFAFGEGLSRYFAEGTYYCCVLPYAGSLETFSGGISVDVTVVNLGIVSTSGLDAVILKTPIKPFGLNAFVSDGNPSFGLDAYILPASGDTIVDLIEDAFDRFPHLGLTISEIADATALTATAEEPTEIRDWGYPSDPSYPTYSGWIKFEVIEETELQIDTFWSEMVDTVLWIYQGIPNAGSFSFVVPGTAEAPLEPQAGWDDSTGYESALGYDGEVRHSIIPRSVYPAGEYWVAVHPYYGSAWDFGADGTQVQINIRRFPSFSGSFGLDAFISAGGRFGLDAYVSGAVITDAIADAPDVFPAVGTSITVEAADFSAYTAEGDDPDHYDATTAWVDWFGYDPTYTGWIRFVVPEGGALLTLDTFWSEMVDTVLVVYEGIPTTSSLPYLYGDDSYNSPVGDTHLHSFIPFLDPFGGLNTDFSPWDFPSGTYYVLVFPYDGPGWDYGAEGTQVQITITSFPPPTVITDSFGLDAILVPAFGLDAIIVGEISVVFGLDAVIQAAPPRTTHPRTGPHYGAHPDTVVVTSATLGSLPPGTDLHAVIVDLDALLTALEEKT